jgi:hypothetical protein
MNAAPNNSFNRTRITSPFVENLSVSAACARRLIRALGCYYFWRVMMLSDDEIERRRPVWLAVSELWLDTELDENDLERIAAVMSLSGYSLDELRGIYLHEVAPVVYLNTLSMTGAWAGFDEGWLYNKIMREVRRAGPMRRFLHTLKKPLMTYATESLWRVLGEKVASTRRTQPNNGMQRTRE